jgi:hypothetical protein
MIDSSNTWKAALAQRDDLQKYGSNGIGLFALILHHGLEDIESIATEAVVDGADDKKCDIIYIDRSEHVAVVAQCYESKKASKEAPANKASDLSTAIGWLLSAEPAEIPPRIQSQAAALRKALEDESVTSISIWYAHNLPESENVGRELGIVEKSAQAILRTNFPQKKIQVVAKEIGSNTLENWYAETQTPILVSDTFTIKTQGAFELQTSDWKACVAAIPTSFLRRVYRDKGVRLFSANIRDYLGARRSDSNINNAIMQTAQNEPENFWAYNNGITVLVNEFALQGGSLKVQGMSVVNGAQTTGALGSVNKTLADSWVPARFIKTSNQEIVSKVIRFNNSQNKVSAADFRSTDRTQKRLREEFSSIPDAEYEGGRRGGVESVIRRRKNLLPSFTVGQALAALHGEPVVAYNEKTNIWERDPLYGKYFGDSTTARHLVFAYSLLRAIESRKFELMSKQKDGKQLMKAEESQLSFYRNRGSTYLAVAAVAGCLETFLGRAISNIFKISFGSTVSPEKAQQYWARIVSTVAPMFVQLEPALKPRLENPARVRDTIATFQSLIEATVDSNKSVYDKFASHVIFN